MDYSHVVLAFTSFMDKQTIGPSEFALYMHYIHELVLNLFGIVHGLHQVPTSFVTEVSNQ